jgi:hypothetical protein
MQAELNRLRRRLVLILELIHEMEAERAKALAAEGPASLAILLKFIEAHEARQAAREALDADVAIGLSAMRFAPMRWNHSLRRTSGSSASGEISATGRGPPRARFRQIGRPCAESSRLDDFDPDEQTFSRPAAPPRG